MVPSLKSIVTYALAHLLTPKAVSEWARCLNHDGTRRLPDRI